MRKPQATPIAIFLLLQLYVAAIHAQRVVPGVNPQHYQQVPVHQQQQYQQQHHPQHQQQQQQQFQQQQHQGHVAPGVAPQQYQAQQQYQQVPVQQQQQQQQPPQQQQYQQQAPQVPQGQPPQQQQQQQQQQQPHHQQQQQPPQPAQAGHHHQAHGGHGQPQQVLNAANIQQERAHIQEHMQVPIDTSKMSEAELQFHYFKMHDSDNNNKLDGCELIKSLIHWHEQGSKEPHTEQKPHVEEKVFSDEELVALIDPILQMDDTSRDGYIDYPEFIKAQQKAASQQQQQQQQQPQQGGADDKNKEHDEHGNEHDKDHERKEGQVYTDQGLADVIDYVLSTMDLNKDGYVDYAEYRKSEDAADKDKKN